MPRKGIQSKKRVNLQNQERERLKKTKRIVIKIGTSTICLQNSAGIDKVFLSAVAHEVQRLREDNREVIIVSSGAIGMGSLTLQLEQRSQNVALQQACASIGQPLLMQAWREAFLECGIISAQILITRDQFNDRRSFNNLKTAMEKLIKLGVIPIVNENDSISTEEIGRNFGDNDQLSAFVASKINADLLILLSDVDGLYDSNPQWNPTAHRTSYVEKLDQEHFTAARGRGSAFSSGGMVTKLKAVSIAKDAGCLVVLAHGQEKHIINRICQGEEIGTFFDASSAMGDRRRWIKNAVAQGSITIDNGAIEAILTKGSLLPKGIVSIHGVFKRGSVVLVNNQIKLITSFNSSELEKISGRHSNEIQKILGKNSPEVVARPENIVVLKEKH